MSKNSATTAQPHHPQPVKSSSQKPPINVEALTPQQRTRLDQAVMILVEYLVAASTQTG